MKMLILNHEKLYLKRMIGLILVLFISIIGTTNLYGQEQNKITIKGVAQDSSGEALPEVLIYEKNNPDNEVFSDIDGNYSIQANPNSTLVFEFVGLDTQEIDVNGQTNLNAMLVTTESNDLEEVVVVGFGTQTKANVTGAVSQIKIDEVSQPVSNPTQLLYGAAPGVNLVQNSGEPGSSSAITIRGAGIGNNQPLIVVDGVIGVSLDDISPSDIETFTILKDAASASIYGSRAANGVILVTTKMGKSGKLKININSSTGYTSPTTLPNILGGVDYMNAINERNQYGFGNAIYENNVIQAYQNGALDPNYFGNTTWTDELFGTGSFSNQYLSIRGGDEKTKYFFSAQYNHQEGTLKSNSVLDTYAIRTKIDFNLTDWLTFGTNIMGSLRNSKSPRQSVSSIVRDAMQADPLRPVYYTNGDYNAASASTFDNNGNFIPTDFAKNPVFNAHDGRRETNRFKLNSLFYAKAKILEGLTYEPSFTYKYNSANIQERTPMATLYLEPTRENIAFERTNSGDTANSLFRNATLNQYYQIDNILRYNKDIGENHSFSSFIGYQLTINDTEGDFQLRGYEFPSDNLSAISTGNPDRLITNGLGDRSVRFQSYFGRIGYQFKNRYLFEANFRADQSSLFPTSERTAYFPSFSAGWKISEENFMQNSKSISLLKLRGSWGQLGNVSNLASYGVAPYIQTYDITDGYFLGGTLNPGVNEGREARDLTWETSETLDFGFDMTLWNKLSITADWYKRKTFDVIQPASTPDLTGTLPPLVNNGDYENTGAEFAINFNNRSNTFKYNIGFNVNYNENEITALPTYAEGEYIISNGLADQINRIGQPIGSYYGYVADGIYQTAEEVDNDPAAYERAQPGKIRYKDLNGDGQLTAEDRTIIGNINPKWTYGIQASASYKGFDFMMNFNGVQGVDRLRPQNGYDVVQGNLTTDWLNRWSPTNPTNEFPIIDGQETKRFSSWHVEDGSYLRLKVAELGYSLPSDLTDKWGIGKLRFFLSGTNLLTFTNFTDGWDPEKNGSNFRNENYPLNKTFVAGFNLEF